MQSIEMLSPWLDQYSSTLPAQSRYGYSSPNSLLSPELRGYATAVSLMLRMNSPAFKGVMPNGPSHDYDEEQKRCNSLLTSWAEALTEHIKAKGHMAMAFPPASDDSKHIQGFSHRAIAVEAGFGWIGRSALLVTRDWGPRIRLATVLTDIPAENPTGVTRKSFCASCSRCVRACPAKALYGELWQHRLPMSLLLNSGRCREWKHTQYPQFNGNSCGICEAVCPYGLQSTP